MTRVCIVCEGPTEVEFVKRCLAPHLFRFQLHAYPTLIQAPSGRGRGGNVSVERLVKLISHEYHSTDRISTLVDFYGFKDGNGRTRTQLEVDILSAVANRTSGFDPRYFVPYVQMYEFEGLLFSDTEQFCYVLDGWSEETRQRLAVIRNQFATPEDINNSRETAPSKRILSIFSNAEYSKAEHGPIIAEEIGLEKIRAACPQFHYWLERLEQWGRP